MYILLVVSALHQQLSSIHQEQFLLNSTCFDWHALNWHVCHFWLTASDESITWVNIAHLLQVDASRLHVITHRVPFRGFFLNHQFCLNASLFASWFEADRNSLNRDLPIKFSVLSNLTFLCHSISSAQTKAGCVKDACANRVWLPLLVLLILFDFTLHLISFHLLLNTSSLF